MEARTEHEESGAERPALESRIGIKGQVTIPVELRERLGLKPRDTVTFEMEGDSVRLRPRKSRLARWFGVVMPPDNVSFDEHGLKEEVARLIAEEASSKDR